MFERLPAYDEEVPQGRPAIPAEIKRAVLVEAGHRCAIPTCRQHPVQIDHIEDWAKVGSHEPENLIALCPNCHARKTRGEIDRPSMRQYKANLAVLNSRYGELERRLLDAFASVPEQDRPEFTVRMARGMDFAFWYLLHDGHIVNLMHGSGIVSDADFYKLTDSGLLLVKDIADARPLHDTELDVEVYDD